MIDQALRELRHMAKDPDRMSFKELQEFELKGTSKNGAAGRDLSDGAGF
jgi:hypothetical protein